MSDTRLQLPQQNGGWFLTDGGLETVLIYQDGIALPEFAAFVLLESQEGRASLQRYFRRYLAVAANTPSAGFILESPTWRAGIDWGAKLGFDKAAMQRVNSNAIALMRELESEYADRIAGDIVVSGPMISRTSPPELKLPPAPVITTLRTSPARVSPRNRSRSSAYESNDSGFLRSGRSSVIVATLPSPLASKRKCVAR